MTLFCIQSPLVMILLIKKHLNNAIQLNRFGCFDICNVIYVSTYNSCVGMEPPIFKSNYLRYMAERKVIFGYIIAKILVH